LSAIRKDLSTSPKDIVAVVLGIILTVHRLIHRGLL
jgi:hypothetical protein